MRLVHHGLHGVVVYADRALMARVVDNVVGNAVHHGGDGGTVAVAAALRNTPPGEWTPTMVTLAVSDTGPGIPAADHERIFERFYRVDPSRARQTGGSGLGLAICREVLAVLGGTIRVGASGPAARRWRSRCRAASAPRRSHRTWPARSSSSPARSRWPLAASQAPSSWPAPSSTPPRSPLRQRPASWRRRGCRPSSRSRCRRRARAC